MSPRSRAGPAEVPKRARTIVVVGTGTGVGKTVFASFLARRLRGLGCRVAALKPVCSGGRQDARRLRDAAGAGLPLDWVNPWWFRVALTPREAARRAGLRLGGAEILAAVRKVEAMDFEVILVEGAGGLLSPLTEAMDARDLMVELGAVPVVVAANRLGALNEVFLTMEALPAAVRDSATVVVMAPVRMGLAARTNLPVIRERLGPDRVVPFPYVGNVSNGMPVGVRRALDRVLARLMAGHPRYAVGRPLPARRT